MKFFTSAQGKKYLYGEHIKQEKLLIKKTNNNCCGDISSYNLVLVK